jgi:SAM-dependent methyltransferase
MFLQKGVFVPNAAQVQEWNGATGWYWATHAERYDAMLSRVSDRLFAAADIASPERVLDVGCGCGRSTRIAARYADTGAALGVDLSEPMLEQARRLAAEQAITNIDFVQADVQQHRFDDQPFDIVISQLGVMFFDDPGKAFANLHSALRPGGRIAFLCWQEQDRNAHRTVPQAAIGQFLELPPPPPPGSPGAFSLADPDRLRGLLGAAGYREIALASVNEPLFSGTDAEDAAAFLEQVPLIRRLLDNADPTTAGRARNALRAALAEHETADGVLLDSAAWLVTASTG